MWAKQLALDGFPFFRKCSPHWPQSQCSMRWVKCNRKPSLSGRRNQRLEPRAIKLAEEVGGVNLGKERVREEES